MTTYLPFRQARWYTATNGRNTRLAIIHTTEGTGTAASNQAMFATWERVVSAHYIVGTDGVAPCVRIKDVAYAAPGANRDGIQIEIIGKAAWSRTDWLTAHAVELEHTAQLLADICVDCDIPAVFLDFEAVLRGERGITTHVQITRAYPSRGNGHWDPGPGFPIDVVMARVIELLHPVPLISEDEMPDYMIRIGDSWDVFACYASGKVRHLGPAEFAYLKGKVPFADGAVGPSGEKDQAEIDRLSAAAAR